jgi:hypothetical protein
VDYRKKSNFTTIHVKCIPRKRNKVMGVSPTVEYSAEVKQKR